MQFNQICQKIKSVKIQGAENIALTALKALSIKHNKNSIKKLLNLRPTEPFLENTIKFVLKHKDISQGILKAKQHILNSQRIISRLGAKIIKNNSTIFTHCHSSTVINVLKQAKKIKRFQVINTETRPLFQGRITAKELSKLKIKVTTIVDSAASEALTKGGTIKKADIMLIGADAILKNGNIINKIGSKMFAKISHYEKIPVYIATNSWKFTKKNIKIEQRPTEEIWKNPPKNIKIKNPAFEEIPSKYITSIISELGILTPKQFIKKVKTKK